MQASDSDFIQVVSARDLRDKGVKTSEDARREFGTNLVLESSLQRSGNRFASTARWWIPRRIVNWRPRPSKPRSTDAFGLQDKIVSAALDMLPTQINPEQRNQLAARPDTEPAAYEAYVRGRGYLQEYEKPENIDNAIAEFNQALKIDPNYARPTRDWAKLTGSGINSSTGGNSGWTRHRAPARKLWLWASSFPMPMPAWETSTWPRANTARQRRNSVALWNWTRTATGR